MHVGMSGKLIIADIYDIARMRHQHQVLQLLWQQKESCKENQYNVINSNSIIIMKVQKNSTYQGTSVACQGRSNASGIVHSSGSS